MKNFFTKFKYAILGGMVVIGGTVLAAQITVPSGPSAGYLLQSLSTGNYNPVSLIAGSNVTIATTTTSITISSTGGGGTFPFTSNVGYNSTSTTLGLLNGFFSTASSTLSGNTFFPALSQGVAYIGTNGKLNSVASSSLNVGTATALAANGTNCSAGNYPLGVDASGNVESCTAALTGTVTAVSVASANGFAGSSSGGATPALTLTTSISGVLKGNGTAISAAANGTDYTLITANTCGAGNHVSAITAAGSITCSADTGSGLSSYDAWTHPAVGQSATTSVMQFYRNASTSQLTATSSVYLATVNGLVGIGTTSPKELLNLSQSTGYTTVRVDSGINSGYMSVNDAFPALNVGSNSNIPTQFVQNNTPVASYRTDGWYQLNPNILMKSIPTYGYLYIQSAQASGASDNGLNTIVVVSAPTSTPQEATLTLERNTGSGNREFSDLTNESYGTTNALCTTSSLDCFDSWNIAKQGTGALRPFGIRFWNQDLGAIHANGKFQFIVDPSGATAIGDYSSTTGAATNKYDKTIPLQVSSSTASTIFQVSAGTTVPRFLITSAGIASTTNLRISLVPNCSTTQALTTDSTGLVVCGTISGGGSGTVGTGSPGQFGFYSSQGTSLAGSFFGYASSTNGVAILGDNAGGQNATTSATITGVTAIGSKALNALGSGTQSTAVGYQALMNATSTSQSTAVGYAALRGNASFLNGGANTAVGYLSMTNNQSGINNVAVGGSTLTANTTGNSNTAMGLISLTANTTGGQNTGMGQSALGGNIGGSSNTSIGYSSMLSNTSGGSNTCVGRECLNFTISGSNNVAMGYRAGFGVAANSFSNNTFLGYQSGNAITTGSGNFLGGYQSGASLTTGSANIILGQNVDVPIITGSGQLNVGNVLFGTGLYNNSSSLSAVPVSGGAIGIGTSTPYYSFTVASTTGPQIALADGTAGVAQWTFRNAGGNLYVATTTVAGTATSSISALTILALNNAVGIGTTTPSAALAINAGAGLDYLAIGSSTGDVFRISPSATTLVGIATSTPTAQFSQDLASSTAGTVQAIPFARLLAWTVAGAKYMIESFDYYGHRYTQGPVPALTSCGTSPSFVGGANDSDMVIQVGSVSATGCTITFAKPYITAPRVNVTNRSMSVVNALGYTVSASQIVITQTGLTSAILDVAVQGTK